jgi:hypothetical protein
VTSCLVTLPGMGLEISRVWEWEWQWEWDFRGRGVGRFCWGVGEGKLWILKGSPGAMSTRASGRGTEGERVGWRGG